MQLYADIYLLLNYSTRLGRPSRLSSRKTVVAASGTDHTIWEVRFFKRDQIRVGLRPSVLLVGFLQPKEYRYRNRSVRYFKPGVNRKIILKYGMYLTTEHCVNCINAN